MESQPWALHAHDSGARLPLHAHDATHLVVVLAGHFTDVSAGTTRSCTPATVLLRAAGEPHEDRFCAARSSYVTMAVAATLLEPLPVETIATRHRAAAQIAAALEHNGSSAKPVVTRLLTGILRHVVRRARVQRARQLIVERSREPARISAIAAEVGLDPLDLPRAFRREYGRTPSQFRAETRVLRACDELRRIPRLPLAEIAAMCGFYDQSHMTNAFRRLIGVTPLQYADSSKTAAGGGRTFRA